MKEKIPENTDSQNQRKESFHKEVGMSKNKSLTCLRNAVGLNSKAGRVTNMLKFTPIIKIYTHTQDYLHQHVSCSYFVILHISILIKQQKNGHIQNQITTKSLLNKLKEIRTGYVSIKNLKGKKSKEQI